MSEVVERAVKTYARGGNNWPDTVHLVRVDHTYGPNIEYVVALCGRRGTGKTAYASSPRCKACSRKASVALVEGTQGGEEPK